MDGLFPSFWLALSSCVQVVEREFIVSGAVGFPTNVDDCAESPMEES
jgi:hypothetical protein